MFGFANPQYLYLLLLLPAIAAMFWLARRVRLRQLKKFGRQDVIDQLMPDVSRYKPYIQLSIELAGRSNYNTCTSACWVVANKRHCPWHRNDGCNRCVKFNEC